MISVRRCLVRVITAATVASVALGPSALWAMTPQDWVRSMARDLPPEVFHNSSAETTPAPTTPTSAPQVGSQDLRKASRSQRHQRPPRRGRHSRQHRGSHHHGHGTSHAAVAHQ